MSSLKSYLPALFIGLTFVAGQLLFAQCPTSGSCSTTASKTLKTSACTVTCPPTSSKCKKATKSSCGKQITCCKSSPKEKCAKTPCGKAGGSCKTCAAKENCPLRKKKMEEKKNHRCAGCSGYSKETEKPESTDSK